MKGYCANTEKYTLGLDSFIPTHLANYKPLQNLLFGLHGALFFVSPPPSFSLHCLTP